MHINYCEQGQSVKEACQIAAKLGFEGIEFRRRSRTAGKTDEEYLAEIEEGVKGHDFQELIFAGGPNAMGKTDEELDAIVAEELAFYKKVKERFPVKVLNCFTGPLLNPIPGISGRRYSYHGAAVANERHWEAATRAYQAFGDGLTQLGLKAGFETHGGYLHDSMASTQKLVELINRPSIGTLWDQVNQLLLDEPTTVAQGIEISGKSLHAVHFKNALILPDGGYVAVGLSFGQVNVREQVRLLQEIGYDGPLVLEAPRAGDRVEFAKQDLAYFKSILQDLDIR